MPADSLYHPDFMARIVQRPEGLDSGYIYDSVTDTFAEPLPEPAVPDADADRDAMAIDQEYRLTLLELGVI